MVDDRAQRLLGVALVAGDVSAAGIARFGKVHVSEAEHVLATCRAEGLVDDQGRVEEPVAVRLVADLPVELVAEVHAAAARHLMAGGPAQLVAAVGHARAAGVLVPLEELVGLADRGGRICLSLRDYESASALLSLAEELDGLGDARRRGARLVDLASAADGLGEVRRARELLGRAAALGELAGDAGLVVRAAVAHAFPVDWYAGDPRSVALLERARQLDLSPPGRVAVDAARGLVEMRIPLHADEGHQLAWVTRPGVAQPMTEDALTRSEGMPDAVRVVALQAWRATHRSSAVLGRRREVSLQALDAAQRLSQPSFQVEAAVWLAVDALESGDRPLHEEAVAVAQWVAQRDGNPRLRWRADTLSAGAAHLDGDLERAERYRHQARTIGQEVDSPGWLGADLLLLGQVVLAGECAEELERHAFPEDFPAFVNPLGRAVAAGVHARIGNHDIAERMVRKSLDQLDPEASYLVQATRCADAALLLDSPELWSVLVELLSPWEDRIAVDSNAWWCDGPVALWLAALQHRLGAPAEARRLLALGEASATRMGDRPSMRRAHRLRAVSITLPPRGVEGADHEVGGAELSAREIAVLRLMVAGATNRTIAGALSYSLGTIRADTSSIYRKLGTRGRADTVATALALGIVAPDGSEAVAPKTE